MSKTEKIIIVLNQMILLPVASGGIIIRFYPFHPFDPFYHPVVLAKRGEASKLIEPKRIFWGLSTHHAEGGVRILEFESSDVGSNPAWLAEGLYLSLLYLLLPNFFKQLIKQDFRVVPISPNQGHEQWPEFINKSFSMSPQ